MSVLGYIIMLTLRLKFKAMSQTLASKIYNERMLKSIGLDNIFRNFYEKRSKQLIVLTTFYISHVSDVKTFINFFINNCFKSVSLTRPIQ